jgi:hypothetical protein
VRRHAKLRSTIPATHPVALSDATNDACR